MTTRSRRCRGFTIVELLVVIGVLALLLGMLLPALSGVTRKSYKQKELSALRQIGMAWVLYSNSSNDYVPPGYLECGVQDRWRVSYEFQDRKLIPPAPDPASCNDTSNPNMAGPWTWRLLPYLGYDHSMVHAHLHEPEVDAFSVSADPLDDESEAFEIAFEPGFAYNAYYVGGWWEDDGSGIPRYRFYDSTASVPVGSNIVTKRVNVVSRTVASIKRSSDLVTFCSATKVPQGLYRHFDDSAPGWHAIVPPILPARMGGVQWTSPGISLAAVTGGTPTNLAGSGPATRSGESDPEAVLVEASESPVPIGRYTGNVALLHADGSTATATPGALVDQRVWIDMAEQRTFEHD